MKDTLKKIGNAILDVLVVLILIISLLIVVLSVTSKKSGIPNIFGYSLLSVQTDSMEPTFKPGDLIVCRIPDDNAEYEVEDVVTFRQVVDRTVIYNTHRIVEKVDINGYSYYITKGDNTLGEDDGKLMSGDILAQWTGFRIPAVGNALDFLRSGLGFFLVLMIPVILFFLYYLFVFIRNLSLYNKEKAVEEMKEAASQIEEDQKQRIIAEYLAAQKAKEEAAAKTDESQKE